MLTFSVSRNPMTWTRREEYLPLADLRAGAHLRSDIYSAQTKSLQQIVSTFIAQHNISPFRETQAPAFLESLIYHPDHLIASVAQFEFALTKVRRGDPASYAIPWLSGAWRPEQPRKRPSDRKRSHGRTLPDSGFARPSVLLCNHRMRAVFRGSERIHSSISLAPCSSTTLVLIGGICFSRAA